MIEKRRRHQKKNCIFVVSCRNSLEKLFKMAYNLRKHVKSRVQIKNRKVQFINDDESNHITLAYGLRTPKKEMSSREKGGGIINRMKTPVIMLRKLEDEERNGVFREKHEMPSCSLNNDTIRTVTEEQQTSKAIYLIFFLYLLTGILFVIYNWPVDLDRNLKPAYQLILSPVRALNKVNSEVDVKLKSEAIKIKRNLFIEQECSNLRINDLQYDFASEVNGARILSTFDTEPYSESLVNFKFLGLNLGPIPSVLFPQSFFDSNGPSSLLERYIKIKNCWTFRGRSGRARIAFARPIYLRKVILQDFSNFGQGKNYVSNSAPRYFTIMGIDYLDNGQEIKNHLGSYEFEKNGGHTQIFPVISEADFPYSIIEFQVTANHGNKDFTCVYRLKVYGNV